MTSHPRNKPYRPYEVARVLGVSQAAVASRVRHRTIHRNTDGTIPASEVERWRKERRERLTRELAALDTGGHQ